MLAESKKDILLEHIIKEYIQNREPIGSEYLRLRLDIKISSSSIRNYFKKMVEEGELIQPHTSSGRVPTNSALREYWESRLNPFTPINITNIDNLKKGANDAGIFCMVKFYKPNRLKEIINAANRYIIAVFENGELVVEYNPYMSRFLNEFVGIDMRDLKNITDKLHLESISRKIDEFLRSEPIKREGSLEFINMLNEEPLDERIIEAIFDGDIIDSLHNGIYFDRVVPDGYLAIKQDASIKNEDAKLFFLGNLFKDFEKFYLIAKNRSIKES